VGICFIAEIMWETMIPHANFHWCRIIGCWVIHHVFLSEQIKMMMMMMMMMIRLPNFVEIGPSSADIWYIDFQDGGRWGPISLTVTDRVMPLSLKGPYLSANQMSYNWIHVWVIATFGWKNKRPPYWNSTSGFGVDHITVLGMSFCTRYQSLSKSDHPQRRYDVISIFKMAAAATQFHSRFRILWRRCLQEVRVYHKTKFHSYNSIHDWDITISGLEKQTSAILEFYFRFRIRPYHRSRHVIMGQSAKFHPRQKNDVTSIFRIADLCHLEFYGSILGSLDMYVYHILYVYIIVYAETAHGTPRMMFRFRWTFFSPLPVMW